MMYLSGHYSEKIARAHPKLGFIITPETGYAIPGGITWAADNGCFAHPDRFRLDRYISWLESRGDRRLDCLFATAPDRVGDAEATLDLYQESGPAIRSVGYKAALVAQDGLQEQDVPWGDLDCLFIGGSTSWKLSEPSWRLGAEALHRGKWVHLGRVNSGKRFRSASVAGYHSVDGTVMAFGPDINLAKVIKWLDHDQAQSSMTFWPTA